MKKYSSEEVISIDIDNDESYVILKDGKIAGTTVISFNIEKTYNHIVNGKWLTNGEYAAIHRIAVKNEFKGLGILHKMVEYAEKLCHERNIKSIKGDTHRDNLAMQKFLKKNGFEYCGIIYLEDGAERVAFEKLL